MSKKQDDKGHEEVCRAHPPNFYRLVCTDKHRKVANQNTSDAILERETTMNTYPRLESRVSSLEHRQTVLEARVEEKFEDMTTSIKRLSYDLDASFQKLAQYQMQTEDQIAAQFKQVDAQFKVVDARFNKIDERLDKIDARFDKVETRLDKMETLLTQILVRLPENPQYKQI
jgi:DNA repair exonuclease SbcCD ATPase subunit